MIDPDHTETLSNCTPLGELDNRSASDSPSFTPDELLLDRFRIIRFIGRGGMGEVYEVRDLQLGRIALKTIRRDLADTPLMLARFRQEVQLARKITSPNVCRIHELFTLPAGGHRGAAAFLTMEFLDGIALADRIKRDGGLPFPEAESIALQLCAAIQAIHDAGVIHRDIKARNVMLVARHGTTQAVVMDLGLARESVPGPDREADLTLPGAVMGTPEYMAPEQFRGAQATPATDVFGLGVLLYEIVTGKRPFHEATLRAAAVRRTKCPPPASSARQAMPRQWDTVINRCLEYEPALRYQSANEVREALLDRGTRPRRLMGYAAAALLLVGAAIGIVRSPLLNRSPQSSRALVAQTKTVVVLPFENLGGNAADQAFCDGLQETMTSMLSQAEAIRGAALVVPASEMRRNQVRTIADARRVFNAGLALGGSVQKNSEFLQITLNLTDTQSQIQRDSRILLLKPDEMALLPQRLADQINSLLGKGSALHTESSSPGETTRDSAAYTLYIEGQGALQSRDWDHAIDNLQKASSKDPDFTAAAARLAEAYVRKYGESHDTKWLAQADSVLNQVTRNGSMPEVLFAQALIWEATGESGKAAPLLRQLLQADPNNVEALDLLAQTLKEAGKYTEAEEAYQTAVRLRPGYWPAYSKLASYYMEQHDYPRAEQAFTAGIGFSPEVPSLHSNLGALYFNMSRWDDAAREFRKSVELKPYAPGYSNLGTVLFFEGKYAEAARQFEEAVRLQPANHITWGNLGDARWQIAGERERARDAFQQAYVLASRQLVLNPSDVQLRKSNALYLAKLGRPAEARTEIEAALRRAPKDRYVRFYAARVYATIGDLQRAGNELKASLALGYESKEAEREPDLKPLQMTGDTDGVK